MTRLFLCLCAGLALSLPARSEGDAWLTAPADPMLGNRPARYAPVTAGIRGFRVVEPKDWRELNRAAAAKAGSMGGMDESAMPGMSQGGMSGMKGMDHGGMNMPGRRSNP